MSTNLSEESTENIQRKNKILVVDDELSMREILSILFEQDGYDVRTVENVTVAKNVVQQWQPDIILSDLNMVGQTGIDLLRWSKQHCPEIIFVVITAFGSNQSAVEAMKLGAANYVLKPFNNDELRLVVSRAMGVKTLQDENASLKQQMGIYKNFGYLVGSSQVMQEVYEMVRRVRNNRINCMISGESGTGKEMVARAIHYSGVRAEFPFVTINCGAIPENLVESELFGHKKGSFTGAYRDKLGLLAVANQGTVFLDEIDALSINTQVKLLRAIQEKEITAVGDIVSSPIDIRIICASNTDIEAMVKEGQFREDLFYRLNVVEIYIPPLRERGKDIEDLVQYFLHKYAREYDKRIIGVSPDAMLKLKQWRYPGNVRELQNAVERSVALCVGNIIHEEDLPNMVNQYDKLDFEKIVEEIPEEGIDLDGILCAIEKKWLEIALRTANGKKTTAADLLKMSFRSFRYRLLKHNLE